MRMSWMKNRRGWVIGLSAILVFALAAGAAVWLKTWDTSATVGSAGGEARDWRRDVAVRVEPGGVARETRITFKDPAAIPPQAPIDSLLKVVGGPVDIVPDSTLSKASVVFSIDPSQVQNAGIQVFNPKLGWIPLETRVEGDKLVADAPHFSMYRAVAVEPGQHNVTVGEKVIPFTIAADDKPLGLFMQTGIELAKQMANNATGTFDDGKFRCQPAHPEYKVTANPPTNTAKVAACVITRDQPHGGTLVIKNGWALPMMFSTDAPSGVSANVAPVTMETVPFVRNVLGKVAGNFAFVSGLETGSFTIGNAAPDSFTVTGRISWSATAVELAMSMLTVFFPQKLLASQTDMGVDFVNCVAVTAQSIFGMASGEIAGKLADLLSKCAVNAMVEKFGYYELLKAVGQELKLIPALKNLVEVLKHAGLHQEDLSRSSFTIAMPGKEFEILLGNWFNECGGRDNIFKVDPDYKGAWINRQYNPNNSFVEHNTLFHLEMDGNTPVAVIDATQMPGLTKNDRLRIRLAGYKMIVVGDHMFYREDISASPC